MCAVSSTRQREGLFFVLLCLLRPTTLASALAINVSSAAPQVLAETEYGPIIGFTDGEGDDSVEVSRASNVEIVNSDSTHFLSPMHQCRELVIVSPTPCHATGSFAPYLFKRPALMH